MSHVYKECLTCQAERLQANNCRRLHNNSTKHHSLVPLLQELVCHPSAGLLVLHDDAFLCRPCPCFRKLEEKLYKLREDTRKLEEELKEALLRSCMGRLV